MLLIILTLTFTLHQDPSQVLSLNLCQHSPIYRHNLSFLAFSLASISRSLLFTLVKLKLRPCAASNNCKYKAPKPMRGIKYLKPSSQVIVVTSSQAQWLALSTLEANSNFHRSVYSRKSKTAVWDTMQRSWYLSTKLSCIREDHKRTPLQKCLSQHISKNVNSIANDQKGYYLNNRWHKFCKTITSL